MKKKLLVGAFALAIIAFSGQSAKPAFATDTVPCPPGTTCPPRENCTVAQGYPKCTEGVGGEIWTSC